jgi:hypothetical protein
VRPSAGILNRGGHTRRFIVRRDARWVDFGVEHTTLADSARAHLVPHTAAADLTRPISVVLTITIQPVAPAYSPRRAQMGPSTTFADADKGLDVHTEELRTLSAR